MVDKELKIKISTEADTTGAKSAENSIRNLEDQVNKIPGKTSQVEDANKKASSSYSGLSGNIRNASYQFQDIFVQISSGQGVMRALSQQLPQMLSGFGLWGVALGAVAAAAPLVFSAFSGGGETVKEETEKAGTAIDDFKERMNDLADQKADEFIRNFGKLFEDVGKYVKEANEEIDRFNKLTQSGLDSELKLAEAKAKSDKAAIDADPSLTDAQKITQKAKIDDDLANTTERIKKEKIDADLNAKEKNNEAAQEAAVRESKNYEMARLAREEKEKELKLANETAKIGEAADAALPTLVKEKKSIPSQDYLQSEYHKERLDALNPAIAQAEAQSAAGKKAKEYLAKKAEEELTKVKENEKKQAEASQAAKEAAEKSAKDIGNTRAIAENEKQTIAGESRFGREARTSETDSALNKAQKKASDEAERNADKARREQERKERDAERERERRAKVEEQGPKLASDAANQARGLGLSEEKVRYLEQIGKQIALPGDGSKAGTDDELMKRLLSIVESIVTNAPKNGKGSTEEAQKMRELRTRIDNLEKRVTRNSKMY